MGLYGSPDLSEKEYKKPKKPKKPFYKRWWFIVLVIIVVLAAIGGEEEDTPRVAEGDHVREPTANEVIEEEEPIKEDQEFFGLGDVVETNKVKATITEMRKSQGSQFNTPSDGKEFILINMTIENISDKELNISSMLSFDAYVDDVTLNENLGAQIEADNTMDGTVAPGKKIVGTLGYEVSTDWGHIEIHFEPDIWNDTVIKWIIENE